MRGIRLLVFVAACVTAASCSSTAIMGGTGGQNGGGDGGSGAGGTGAGGSSLGGNTGTIDGGPKDGGQAGSGGKSGAGGQSGIGGAGGSDCSPACSSGSVCVGTGLEGGAVFFPDGGVCPPGRHVENNLCVQDLSFACMPIPSGCNGTATCACASSLCNGRVCGTPRPGELTCLLLVP
jgi:hypothetical protein